MQTHLSPQVAFLRGLKTTQIGHCFLLRNSGRKMLLIQMMMPDAYLDVIYFNPSHFLRQLRLYL